MIPYLLFEDEYHNHFLPLTFTRPIYDLRVGIDLIHEKWAYWMGQKADGFLGHEIHSSLHNFLPSDGEYFWINGRFIPDSDLTKTIQELPAESILKNSSEEIIAVRTAQIKLEFKIYTQADFIGLKSQTYSNEVITISRISDLFSLNGKILRDDFKRITKGRKSQPIEDKHSICYSEENIFIEAGAKFRACILNAESGPIYIGKDAEIQEGAIIHGAHAICENAVISMGAKMRGDSTIGPFCKVGGEVSNSVFWGFSSKAHDGFIGNSVIGEWCNLGADTNTSNLKNNYANVKLWNYDKNKFVDTGLQFCGLMMGDHSKCGINTMFNTGTVVGVACNIFGDGFPRTFIPSFSWGGASGFEIHVLKKVFETAEIVMARRNKLLTDDHKQQLQKLFEVQTLNVNIL